MRYLLFITFLFPGFAQADFINEIQGRPLNGDGIMGNRGKTVTVSVRNTQNQISKTILIDSESSNVEIRGKDGKAIVRVDAQEKTLLVRDKNDKEWDLVKTLDNLQPIGTIIYSIKTEAQIQAAKGPGWVRCDGRNVNGSRYQTDGHGINVPDLRNRYLRMSENEENNGKQLAGMVKAGSFSVSAVVTSQGSVSGTMTGSGTANTGNANLVMYERTGQGKPGGPWMFNSFFEFHLSKFIGQINNGNKEDLFMATDGSKQIYNEEGRQEFILDTGHTHPVSVSGSVTGTVSGTKVAASISGGGSETRPNSVIAGAYIRIN